MELGGEDGGGFGSDVKLVNKVIKTSSRNTEPLSMDCLLS